MSIGSLLRSIWDDYDFLLVYDLVINVHGI